MGKCDEEVKQIIKNRLPQISEDGFNVLEQINKNEVDSLWGEYYKEQRSDIDEYEKDILKSSTTYQLNRIANALEKIAKYGITIKR